MERYQTDLTGSQRKRNRFSGVWRRVIVITVLLCSLLLLIIYVGRFIHIHHASRLLAAQQERQVVMLMHNDALQERLMKIDDPEYIEYLARKKLGLAMPGEIKIIFIDK